MSKIDELIAKYNEGLADPSEVKWIEKLIEDGEVELTQLHSLASLDERIMKSEDPSPSMRVDDQFYAMLAAEKKKQHSGFSFQFPSWNILMPRLAFAAVVAVCSFSAGYWLRPSGGLQADTTQVRELVGQVGELKEMMMLSLLEKESAAERLRAVSLTSEMDRVSDKVTKALFQTLNNDPNDNVRLAALEALMPYVKQSNAREELVRSIGHQTSPIVQVQLAEIMVAIQEKKSVREFQKLLDSEQTPKEVKQKIRESIKVLI